MALKSDLGSAKVIRELMALCSEKPRILIITNKNFFLSCLMALKSDLDSAKVISDSRAQRRKDVLDLGCLRWTLVGAHSGLTEGPQEVGHKVIEFNPL